MGRKRISDGTFVDSLLAIYTEQMIDGVVLRFHPGGRSTLLVHFWHKGMVQHGESLKQSQISGIRLLALEASIDQFVLA